MRKHLFTTVLAAGTLVVLAGSARARETQLVGIKLNAPTSAVLDKFGDPGRISPIYNLFRPPTQSAAGSMMGSGGGSGESGGAGAGTENAGQFLQLLGYSGGGTGGGGGSEGGAPMGGPMMGSGSGMSGGYGSEGSGSMGGLAPAPVRPKQTYQGKIASTQPEVFASWVVIPPKMRTIIMMGMTVAMSSAGAGTQGGGGAMGSGSGGSGMMMGGSSMSGSSMSGSGSGGPGGMTGAALSASQTALSKIPGAPGGGAMGGGGMSGGPGGGSSDQQQPIAEAWVYEKPAEGMTYLFFADGGRVSLIAAGDDRPYSITKGGKKPVFPGVQTSKGIGLGDTFDKVILTYGWPEATETMGDEIVLRYFGRQGVAFTLRQTVMRVDSIVIKLPGE